MTAEAAPNGSPDPAAVEAELTLRDHRAAGDVAESAEVAVLVLALTAGLAPAVLAEVEAEDFTSPWRQAVFGAMQTVHARGAHVDAMAVYSELETNVAAGREHRSKLLAALHNTTPPNGPVPANLGEYLSVVRATRERRLRTAHRSAMVEAAESLVQVANSAPEHIASAVERLRVVATEEPVRPSRVASFAGRIETAAALLAAEDIEEPDLVVGDGLLAVGSVSIFAAAMKAGKTLCSLGLAIDVVAATEDPDREAEFLGSPVLGAGPVLYACAEGGRHLLRKRVARIGPDVPTRALERLRFFTGRPRPSLASDEDVRAVYEFARREGCALVVWDPLGRYWPVEDEADPRLAREMLDRVEAGTIDAGAATLLVHHDTKLHGEGKGAITAGRGSGRLGDDASGAIVNLVAVGGDRSRLEARFLVRDGEPLATRQIQLDIETLRFRAVEGEEPASPTPSVVNRERARKVRRELERAGGRMTKSALAKRVGISGWTLVKRAAELAAVDPAIRKTNPPGGAGVQTEFFLSDTPGACDQCGAKEVEPGEGRCAIHLLDEGVQP